MPGFSIERRWPGVSCGWYTPVAGYTPMPGTPLWLVRSCDWYTPVTGYTHGIMTCSGVPGANSLETFLKGVDFFIHTITFENYCFIAFLPALGNSSYLTRLMITKR